MKKLLSIALLLFSIAAPSATYSDEAPRNPEQALERLIPATSHPKTQKEDSIKLATRKRRLCVAFLAGIFSILLGQIFQKIYNIDTSRMNMQQAWNAGKALGIKWPVVVISYVAAFFFDLLFKYLLGMKVVDTSGKDASWTQLLIRHIVKSPPLGFIPLFLFTAKDDDKLTVMSNLSYLSSIYSLIQAIIILVREDRRGPHDLAAKTVVVMRDESTSDSNKSTLA